MSLAIESTRFGRVEIDPDKVITITDGLIGLPGTRYALLEREPGSPLLWLHSVEDPALALPVADPHRYFDGFAAELTESDATRCGLDESTEVEVYVTVRTSGTAAEFTANTRAPILVWSGQGAQVINQWAESALRAPLFGDAGPAPAAPEPR